MQTINEYEGVLQEVKAERDYHEKHAEDREAEMKSADIKMSA